MEREIDFWKDIGIIEYGSKIGIKIEWEHDSAQKRMQKKGFLLLDYMREYMPNVYHEIARQAETKNRNGFVAPDVWAIRNYQAALDILGNNQGLPLGLAQKLSEAHQEASKSHRFYESE